VGHFVFSQISHTQHARQDKTGDMFRPVSRTLKRCKMLHQARDLRISNIIHCKCIQIFFSHKRFWLHNVWLVIWINGTVFLRTRSEKQLHFDSKHNGVGSSRNLPYIDINNQQDATNFRLLIFLNQLYMFRATNSPIRRNAFWLYIQLLV